MFTLHRRGEIALYHTLTSYEPAWATLTRMFEVVHGSKTMKLTQFTYPGERDQACEFVS